MIVIHLGFPKTATTTFQEVIKRSPSIGYIGKGIRDDLSHPSLSLELARAVFFADSERFGLLSGPIRERIEAEHRNAGQLLISDEAFTFAEYMLIGPRWQRQVVSDHKETARRLYALCPDATILYTIRNQFDLMRSFYRQSVKVGKFKEPFVDYVQREVDALPHRSMIHLMKYDELHRAYIEHFDPERIRISLFEDIREDFADYLCHVCQVLGVDEREILDLWGGQHVNEAKDSIDSDLYRRLRRSMPDGLKGVVPTPLKGLVRNWLRQPIEEGIYTAQQEETLRHVFSGSNRAFEALTGLDLAARGYP